MTAYYQQLAEDGRMFLDVTAPAKPENLVSVVNADSWREARDKIATNDFDPRYVKGFVYKEGWGYYREHV
jgi:hypothetical protein